MVCMRAVLGGAVLCLLFYEAASADWTVVLPEDYANEEAVRVALDDLRSAGQLTGIAFSVAFESAAPNADAIVVGGPGRNRVTRMLCDTGRLALHGADHPEGYEITTLRDGEHRTIVIAGGSAAGDVYGLYWVWDRLRVLGEVPNIDTRRAPELGIRFTRTVVKDEAAIRMALRYGLNMVFCENPLNLIPWEAEPERSENDAHRGRMRELATYAHALHMKVVAFGTDFTWHPSLLKEFDATLNPADPRLWDAVQAKYRRLFEAMPELDGVCTFTADEQQYWGDYRTFDVLHGGEGCDWDLAKRYRTFVTKIWDVVVGEYDKLLLLHTWSTNMYEQHSQPAVYRAVFTDSVPTRNLYLFPSFTQNDRWWFQAYNPTINQTPHNTMVVCETMDYHAGGTLFPTFPGPYFQAGLETMMDVKKSNLKGISLDLPASDDWQTRCLTAYSVFRLAWDRHEDVRQIARDFASIHFGPPAAEAMADLLMMSPEAYAYGLYPEPAAYGQFNSLPHIRVGQFIADGYPQIDGGKEHIEFLRMLHLRCKPWIPETLMYLDHGLETARAMSERYLTVRDQIADTQQAEEIGHAVDLTRLLVETNNRYFRTIFAFFAYREVTNEANRSRLEAACSDLLESRNEFAAAPGFRYELFGVDQLLLNAGQALRDPVMAEKALADAPTMDEIEAAVAREQAAYRTVADSRVAQMVKVLHWRGKVDGEDILRVCGSEVTVEHLRWDPPRVERCDVVAELPKGVVTVVPVDTVSRPLRPFVLEQPSEQNGYVAAIYLDDRPGGGDWWEFDLYYVPCEPAELGLRSTLKSGL